MLPTITKIFQLISFYKYALIFPLAIVEGPIITIIGGFLSSIGQLNLLYTYLIVVAGDIVGDTGLYYLGKYGSKSFTFNWLKFIGITRERVLFAEKQFLRHPKKIFSVGKISHGGGAAVLFAAGLVKFPFRKFIMINIILTLIKSVILLLIGYYFGQAYVHIKQYLDYIAVLSGMLFIVLYLLFIKYSSKYLYENTDRDR